MSTQLLKFAFCLAVGLACSLLVVQSPVDATGMEASIKKIDEELFHESSPVLSQAETLKRMEKLVAFEAEVKKDSDARNILEESQVSPLGCTYEMLEKRFNTIQTYEGTQLAPFLKVQVLSQLGYCADLLKARLAELDEDTILKARQLAENVLQERKGDSKAKSKAILGFMRYQGLPDTDKKLVREAFDPEFDKYVMGPCRYVIEKLGVQTEIFNNSFVTPKYLVFVDRPVFDIAKTVGVCYTVDYYRQTVYDIYKFP